MRPVTFQYSHLYYATGRVIGLHNDGERARAHLRHVAMHDARTEEWCGVHQFEELDVVIAVECSVDGRGELDVVGLPHLLT